MTFFWLIYVLLSFGISFLLSFLFKKHYMQIFVFSFTLSVFLTVWFKEPGVSTLSPIFSIFFLELTILDDNGFYRLIRPFLLFFLVTFVLSLAFWKKIKN